MYPGPEAYQQRPADPAAVERQAHPSGRAHLEHLQDVGRVAGAEGRDVDRQTSAFGDGGELVLLLLGVEVLGEVKLARVPGRDQPAAIVYSEAGVAT